MKNKIDERMLELICDKALFGLSPEELRELALYDESDESRAEALSLELAAAKLSTVGVVEGVEMPAHLQEKILAASGEHVRAEPNIFTEPRTSPVKESSGIGLWGYLGWAVAAAACIALAVNLYTVRESDPVVTVPPKPTPREELTPAQQRERLIQTEQGLARAEWGKGNLPETAGISGDVVWSDEKQSGYMRISGLPVNDPNERTYQLWIFDETQSEKTPIDGGTFNVSSQGEVIIPIDAKLNARNPAAFAITVEKPGGVVVSDRKRVAGLAAVKPSQT